jgi:DNA polymerase III alpha subunit
MGNKNYVVYHLHTEDSLLDSCTNYKLYVDKAVELGQRAIAFSEHGNIYNWIEKKMYCDEHNIKYIHGIECYLTETLDEKIRDNYHTVLLAKNYDGVKEINNLIELSTRADHYYYKPRITFDEFFALSDNVIKISACLASPLNKLRYELDKPLYRRETGIQYDRLCKKYDYFEIQPHINSDEQKDYNKHLLKLSKKYNTPLIMGTDTHSLNAYKAECRSILQLSKRIEFSNEDTFDLTYKSYDELVEMCKEQNCFPIEVYLTAIENTNVMADSIENWELDKKVKYPKSYDNEEYVLKKRIFEMYKDKVRRGVITNDKRYIDNIKEELRVFKKINMIGFMLFMSELMCWCKENGIPTSPCRGSVGGSTVAYITDIIDVDPVKWNTVFSRFANEDRVEVGDIDVDIAPDQRKLVYQHIIDKFGTNKTAYILAMGTISDKGTIDDIGRALGIKWSREHNGGENPYSLANVAKIKEEYDINAEATKEKYPELFYYFDGLLGTVVSQSMHPAGIVVSPITLPDNYGVFWGENKEKEKVLILSVNMEEVHECGLVKYDILGLKNIQILRECCKFAGIKYPAAHEIDWEDEDVWKHITDSPVGIFQFESPFAYELLKQYQPRKINDLSLVNASLRPSGTSYRDRLIAREKNKNPSKQIDDLLKENNGFLCIEENQKVSTLNGLKAIKDVSVGDLVYTTSGLEKVNKVFNNGIKDVYELKTKYGSVVCTKDHKVLTENGWKEYQNIELGEYIWQFREKDEFYLSQVISKSYIGEKRVYDLEINNTHNFVAGGIVVHNCFQEDTIKFLQDICGLSGSEADNIRRAIGRKKKDILEKAMPKILDGYCEKSDKPRNIAEQEAKTFLQIIEDSASYQFGYNHSTGYSMVGYLCAYMRYYYPLEFITAYLNCAGSNLKDIESGTELAKQFGIEIRLPKFRHSKGSYWFDKKENCLYKGIGSIKDLNVECGEYLYSLKDKHYKSIIALMSDLPKKIVSSKKLDILIKIGFFDEFGTINNLLEQIKIYNQYNGKKQITKNKLTDEEIKLISTCCEKETDKMFKGIDNVKLMNAIYKSKDIPKTTDLTKAHYQLKLIGGTNVIIPDSEYYGIESTETNSYGTPFITLYDFQNGKTKQFKCNKKWYKDYPCEQGDIVEVGFTQKKKVRFIGTDKNGKNIYQPTGEYEDIIKMYAIQNMEI